MSEHRLEGMANRQEEFLEKLKTTILDDWKNQLIGLSKETGLIIPRHFQVQIQNNSLIVATRSRLPLPLKNRHPPVYQAEVRAEKINDDLLISFSGFEVTKQTKKGLATFTTAVILCGIIAIGIATVLTKEQWHPPPLNIEFIFKLILMLGTLVGIIISAAKWIRDIWNKRKEMLDQALTACIEKTINLFKQTPLRTQQSEK